MNSKVVANRAANKVTVKKRASKNSRSNQISKVAKLAAVSRMEINKAEVNKTKVNKTIHSRAAMGK